MKGMCVKEDGHDSSLVFLIECAGLPHLRRKDFGVGEEVLAEHLDDQVELSQVLPLLCDFEPHQVVVRELPGGRRLLGALGHQADVLLLVEHVHQHLETKTRESKPFVPREVSHGPKTSIHQTLRQLLSSSHVLTLSAHMDTLMSCWLIS